MAKSWALSNWQTGQVSLLQAFGIPGNFTFPQLGATLPSQVDAASQSSPSSGSSPTSTGTVATNLPTYTQSQLQELWIQAGGNPAKALIASAVAMAESGGDAHSTDHDTDGSTDLGLWQINTTHGAQATYDPLGNARSAVAISSNGTDWSAWVAFNNGSYQKFMTG